MASEIEVLVLADTQFSAHPQVLGALEIGASAFRLVHEYVKELAGACRARPLAGLNLFRILPSRNLMVTELPLSATRVNLWQTLRYFHYSRV